MGAWRYEIDLLMFNLHGMNAMDVCLQGPTATLSGTKCIANVPDYCAFLRQPFSK